VYGFRAAQEVKFTAEEPIKFPSVGLALAEKKRETWSCKEKSSKK
jgi:hypothetical protein